MKLKTIKLNNFLSHAETEIHFGENEKFLLDGKSGSGKSSLVDALVWSLFGKGRTDNRSLVQKGKDKAEVTVHLAAEDGTEYKIKRCMTIAGKHTLEVWVRARGGDFVGAPEKGAKGLQYYIENHIVKCSYLLFINSIVFLQDNSEVLVRQTAAKRKEIILEIIKASTFDEYYEKIKTMIASVSQEIEKNKFVLEINEPFLLRLPSLVAEKEAHNEKKQQLEARKKMQEDRVRETTDKILEGKENAYVLEALRKQIAFLDGEMCNLQKQLEESAHLLALRDLAGDPRAQLEEEKKRLRVRRSEWDAFMSWNQKFLELSRQEPAYADSARKIMEIKFRLEEAESVRQEFCPELQKPCPVIARQREKEISALRTDLLLAEAEEKEYSLRLQKFQAEQQALGPAPRYTLRDHELRQKEEELALAETLLVKKENEFGEAVQKKNWATQALAETSKQLEERKKEYALRAAEAEDYRQLLAENDRRQEDLKEVSQRIDTESAIIVSLSKDIEFQQGKEAEVEEYRKKTQALEDYMRDLRTLKGAFGNNGVKSIMIDYTIPVLEERINNILGKMSDFRVVLDTQKQGAGEDVVLEGMFIDILNDKGETLNYDAYSGGEKMKINVAIFEALASLSPLRFRIFDETFFALDQESGDDFLAVLEGILEKADQFVCISHMQNIKDYFDNKKTVIKKEGISKIAI